MGRSGFWVLFATIIASSMAFIDGSALNVALPSLQEDLGATATDLLWIVNGYALMLAALILVGGALGDRFGRKRIFMLGIGLFAVASILCGFAPTTAFLIAARILQGIGGALMIPGSLALISANFGDESRGRAIGTWSSVSTVTTILGPVLGGVLASAGLWRWVFFINVPLAAASLWALWQFVPESRDEHAPPQLDYAGAALATIGLAGVTYGLLAVPDSGWQTPVVWLTLGGGVLLLGWFLLVQARSPNAMMPLSLFRSPVFAGTNLLTLFLYAALYGMLFFLPLNLIQIQGYNETLAGLTSLPIAVFLALLSPWAGGLADRYGPRLPLTVGPAIAGLGFFLLGLPGVTNGAGDYWATYFPGVLALGLGMALTVTPLTAAVMGSVGTERAGIASGVNNAVSRVAGVLAVAVMGLIALLVFAPALQTEAANLGLSDAVREALAAESAKLGGAQVPPDLAESEATAARLAIDMAFVQSFRVLAFVAAGLAWISAVVAAVMLRRS
ncbi:MFS transporter [Candidatus Gracilibacteria bacterium]|nr:MFS transporter [Candidatus Gracilibacteria bacterium]